MQDSGITLIHQTKMGKGSVVFRKEWKSAISGLPDQVRLEIYEAIIEYGTTGELCELSPSAMIAFNFMKEFVDKDNEKYEALCEKRKAIGRKGGLAKATNCYQKLPNVASATKSKQIKQELASVADKDKDMDKDMEYSDNTTDVDYQEYKILDTNVSSSSCNDAAEMKRIVEKFNSILANCGSIIRPIRSIKDKRKSSVCARIRENGIDAFFDVLEKAARSNFLNGGGRQGFVATFDWIIGPNNFTKILEGNYDENQINRRSNGAEQTVAAATEAIAELLADNR